MISHSGLSFFPLIVTQIFTYHKKKSNLNFTANTSFKKKKKKKSLLVKDTRQEKIWCSLYTWVQGSNLGPCIAERLKSSSSRSQAWIQHQVQPTCWRRLDPTTGQSTRWQEFQLCKLCTSKQGKHSRGSSFTWSPSEYKELMHAREVLVLLWCRHRCQEETSPAYQTLSQVRGSTRDWWLYRESQMDCYCDSSRFKGLVWWSTGRLPSRASIFNENSKKG